MDELEKARAKGNMYKMVKKVLGKNMDVVGGGCIKDKRGKVVVEDDAVKLVWKDYYENLLNEEFDWDKDALGTGEAVSGPSEVFTVDDVRKAIKQAKSGKAAGPSGVTSDMLKSAGETGVEWVTDLCNAVVKEGNIPDEWRKSLMVSESDDEVDHKYRGWITFLVCCFFLFFRPSLIASAVCLVSQ